MADDTAEPVGPQTPEPSSTGPNRVWPLTLLALGVVYGDIGTSPLYAVRECLLGEHAVPPTRANVFGVMSLIFWSLATIVAGKYLGVVLRASNRGEGGVMALTALTHSPGQPRRGLLILGLFGAALLYGDGIITPAISVLSAVEGLQVAAPFLQPYVLPLTVGVLVGLFLFQSRGTSRVGRLFGPITLLWFVVIALLGVKGLLLEPGLLGAINPLHAWRFLRDNGASARVVLGAVFLVVTGGEALYADMGHFGPRPIRLGWFVLVWPALVLNYFGQGALLLRHPHLHANPFYALAPEWMVYPLVVLATAATVIASQAVISGAFSLTRQAVQLGYLPRFEIQQTSPEEIGQIYVPQVNRLLMVMTIGTVLGFRGSSQLAAAYGVAVSMTMVITTLLLRVVARERWGWSRAVTWALTAGLLSIELSFLGATLLKVEHGGWFPLLVASIVLLLMLTWHRGRQALAATLGSRLLPLDLFLADIATAAPLRVPGTAVFMTGNAGGIPVTLLHNLKHNKVLHERVLLVTVETLEIPRVTSRDRITVEALEAGFYRVRISYGFMEDPDVPAALRQAGTQGLDLNLQDCSYFLGRESILTGGLALAPWRARLFGLLSRNAVPATAFFKLPPGRVVELGVQIQL